MATIVLIIVTCISIGISFVAFSNASELRDKILVLQTNNHVLKKDVQELKSDSLETLKRVNNLYNVLEKIRKSPVAKEQLSASLQKHSETKPSFAVNAKERSVQFPIKDDTIIPVSIVQDAPKDPLEKNSNHHHPSSSHSSHGSSHSSSSHHSSSDNSHSSHSYDSGSHHSYDSGSHH